MSVPIYQKLSGAQSSEFKGFFAAVVLPSRVAEIALEGINVNKFGLSLRDANAAAEAAELYIRNAPSALEYKFTLKRWQHQFPFADRIWEIIITPNTSFFAEQASTLPWITLIGGLCFTGLITCFLLVISGRTALVEALVDRRSVELAQANAELEASEKAARASELMLRTLIDSQPECVQLLARDGSLMQINRAGLQMFEVESFAEVAGRHLQNFVVPKNLAAFQKLIDQVFVGEPGMLEFDIQGQRGGYRSLETHAVPLRDTEGNISALLGLTRDITARKQVEERLRLAARVFDESHEGIFITDANTVIVDVNRTFCEITGYSRAEIIGATPKKLSSAKHGAEFYQAMWQNLSENKHWQGEIWNRKKSGELYAELLTISALSDINGVTSYYVGLFSDITQSKEQQQQLEMMAHYDPMTKLPNRTLFADRMKQAIAHSKREKNLLAICFLDLDGFKPINDNFGHNAGDQILIAVAERITNCIRAEDSVSRHGGDEFALLLGDLISIEQCNQAIERIHHAVSQPYLIDEQQMIIGASSGITLYPLDDADPDTLLRHADHAMYQAKLAGKNRYHLFDIHQDNQIIVHNQQLRDIEHAFFNNQLCLYFQPKINIKVGKIVGVEALIRWMHPEKGMIPPLEFLPAIASSNLEILIGNWVIESAWQQLALWHKQGLKIEVSVNISAYHLLWPGFYSYLEKILLADSQVNSKYLQLEILESTALDDLTAVDCIIKTCRNQLGLSIALDDFGTGYSSLTHLRRLSIDTVKIDRSFVRDMLDDPDDYAIVESVISLTHAFHHQVIAEGVETKEQGIVLLLLGCHVLQGYSIARPMPATDILSWSLTYQPFIEWQTYAETEFTNEQVLLTILKVDITQWFLNIQACISSVENQALYWPIMDAGKSHFGRWYKQVSRENLSYKNLFAEIEKLNQDLYATANNLMRLCKNGQVEKAQGEFSNLEAIHQQIDIYFDYFIQHGIGSMDKL